MNDFYKQNGYFLVKGLFPAWEIRALRERMVDVFRIYTGNYHTEYLKLIKDLFRNDKDGFIGCANICQNLVELTRFSVDERLLTVVKSLGVDFPSINTRPLVSFSSPQTASNDNYWRIPAHQDWPSTQGSINGLTCWMPLIDVDPELGPLEIAAGTHLLGFIEHDDDGVPKLNRECNFTSIKMIMGDAIFFSNFTIHRSGNNTSEEIRWTVHFRFDDVKEKTFIDRKYPRHRKDVRKAGILYPDFPNETQICSIFL
jgi:phytanoyl-CoA hydroxylase